MKVCIVIVALAGLSAGLYAQGPARGGGPPQSPQAAAPIDLTGYWVSVVNEDWRWRMVTPPKGDFASVPLNPAGQKVGNAWDPSTDGSCLAYGAAGLMRMPTRLHVTWENEQTLKVETDAGEQVRRFLFNAGRAPSRRSLQGYSVATWEVAGAGRGGRGGPPAGPRFGHLKVETTMMSGGWLRKNGVPYSENATLTEYFDRFTAPGGDEWLVVTAIVNDPMYLTQEFVTSSHFKREPDGAKWAPSRCTPAR